VTHGRGPGFGRDAQVNRENKLALIIGFTLILVVGVLVSDHLSRANSAALGADEDVAKVHQPISGGTIRDTIAANIAPRTARPSTPSPQALPAENIGGSLALTDPNPVVIDQGQIASNPSADALGRLADSAGSTINKILDIYSGSAVPAAVELDRAGPRAMITEPTSTIPTSISYEVKPGDNIYRIAARYLGNGERWREIRDRNPGTVGRDGELAVGAKLRIRVLEPVGGATPISLPRARLPISDTPRPIDIGDGAFRTYEVQPGDILGKIAQKQLGTVKRMDEILRLNADQLDDADSIRVGMKIRLPAD
jgi:nucleoid-associated protein YgaU